MAALLLVLTAPAARADDLRDIFVGEVYQTANAMLRVDFIGQTTGPYIVVTGGPTQGVQCIVNQFTPGTPITIPLFAIDNPPIPRVAPYRVVGHVSYGGINGTMDLIRPAYLEMWSTFADGRRYFSRTLADAGPMQKFFGHSNDRPFALEFDPSGEGTPTRLEINLVFTGNGQVTLDAPDGAVLLSLLQDGPPAVAATPVGGPPPLHSSAADIAAAIRLNPTLADSLNKMNYLQARLTALQHDFGPANLAVVQAEQSLRDLQTQVDQQVVATLLVKAQQPRWVSWLDRYATGWWWGFLLPMAILCPAFAARTRWRWFGLAVPIVVGQFCFGWGMAALGSGASVMRFGQPLGTGVSVLLLTLLLQPLIRRQQAAELRRIAVMDAA